MPKLTPESVRSSIAEWLEPGERLRQYTVGGIQGQMFDAIIALTDRFVRIGSPTTGITIPLSEVRDVNWSSLWARLNISTSTPHRTLVIALTGKDWKQRAAQFADEWASSAG